MIRNTLQTRPKMLMLLGGWTVIPMFKYIQHPASCVNVINTLSLLTAKTEAQLGSKLHGFYLELCEVGETLFRSWNK